jgi:predicted DNA-binding transcriptional regulator YafY
MEGEVVAGAPGSFEPPADFDPREALPQDPKTIGGAEPVEALVAVDAVRAGKVRREAGEDAVVEQRADGSIVVRVPSTNEEAFRSWVLGLGEHAEVLAPPEARAALAAWLAAIATAPPP